MSNKKTVSIPSNLGSSNLSDAFGKITLAPEVKELLSALGAKITVSYDPGAEKPTIRIVGDTGKNMCSLDEFKALSGYRRFVGDMLKTAARESSNQQKAELVGYFLREADARKLPVAARMLEQNGSKFINFGSSIKVVKHNLEIIAETIDDVWSDYLKQQGTDILRVLYSAQLECMKSSPVDKAYVSDQLLTYGTPRWLYLKFLDKNFTANVRDEAVTLLFPRNNYLKSIAVSTKELESESFRARNNIILAKSGGIIILSQTDFSCLFPEYSLEIHEQVVADLENYQWTCTSPYTADEILTVRQTGKQLPIFRESMNSRTPGGRPESELGRVTREIRNVLGKIQSTWNGIMHFVIPVANPRMEFWNTMYTGAESWNITPTNSIYDCIRDEGLGPLQGLRLAKTATLLKRIGQIVALSILVPPGTKHAARIIEAFEKIEDNQSFCETKVFTPTIGKDHPMQNLDAMETHPVTADEITKAKKFLAFKSREKTRNRRSGQSSVRLHTSVLSELKPLQATPLYEPVTDWLMSTFKTGDRKTLQLIAAERILGEAIKAQDEIFPDEIGEDELQEIEEYYNED